MNNKESLLAAIHEAVQLEDYDPLRPAIFVLERNRLLSLFPITFVDIQHMAVQPFQASRQNQSLTFWQVLTR